jgi:hypothetical protein
LKKNLFGQDFKPNSSRVIIIFDEIPKLDLSFYVRWGMSCSRLDPKLHKTNKSAHK